MKMKHSVKRQVTMLSGVLIGVGISIILGIILSLITAGMLNTETVGESSIRLLTCGTTVISLAIGIFIAQNIYREKTAIVSIAIAGIYFLVLLCGNLLFFSGNFQGIMPQLLSILCASIIGLLPTFRKKKSFNRKRTSLSR